MSALQEEFLRRYATSPIHVPRLERMLAAYGPHRSEDAFAEAFLGWDTACGDADAARIVTEVVSQVTNAKGQLIRLTDDAVRGAIAWVAETQGTERVERVAALRDILAEVPQFSVAG